MLRVRCQCCWLLSSGHFIALREGSILEALPGEAFNGPERVGLNETCDCAEREGVALVQPLGEEKGAQSFLLLFLAAISISPQEGIRCVVLWTEPVTQPSSSKLVPVKLSHASLSPFMHRNLRNSPDSLRLATGGGAFGNKRTLA